MKQSSRSFHRATPLLVLSACAIALSMTVAYSIAARDTMTTLKELSREYTTLQYCDRHPQQAIDLYLPSRYADKDDDLPPNPLVIYIHGGGWSSGDKRNVIAEYYGPSFIATGTAFASINYRLAPAYRYPTQNEDVACAIATLAQHAKQYRIDPSQVILFGDSAGALLATMYALTATHPPITIRGVIDFYGTTNLIYQLTRTQHRNQNALNYLGRKDLALARRASPLFQPVPSTAPPFLFFHGDNDTVVTKEQSYMLFERVKVVRPESRFIAVTHAGHGFTRTTTPSNAEIRDTMIEFVESVLSPSP